MLMDLVRQRRRIFEADLRFVVAIIGVILLGGAFFTYLLMVLAVALLAFIIAFMLSSGVLLIAMAYSYKLVGESQMRRELHALKVARLRAVPG